MPLKLTANTKTGELKLSWTADDDSMEASWKIQAEDDESTMLDKLEKVVRFVRTQRGEKAQAIRDVEDFLAKDQPPEVIHLPSPVLSGNDLPAGGPPVIGWAALASAPPIPAASAADGWEYIPPEEL